MAKQTNELDLRTYAVLGAEARLLQIAQEVAAIYKQFPELRGRKTGRDLGGTTAASEAPPVRGRRAGRQGGRRPLSSAERQAASERMKKYWAARRAAKGAAGSAEPKAKRASRGGSRGNMSAAARKRISDAQKKRWADWRRKNA
jgi:hypothetical protein